MSDSSNTNQVIQVQASLRTNLDQNIMKMPHKFRRRTRRFVLRPVFSWLLTAAKSSSALASPTLSRKAVRKRYRLIPKKVRHAIWKVGTHDAPDYLVLRNSVNVPLWFRFCARKSLRRNLEKSRWAKRAKKQVICYLAAVGNNGKGYIPIAMCHHPMPEFIYHAKAVEEWVKQRDEYYPHKLPDTPATFYPHMPYGPALFGHQKSQFAGPVSPDLVVFICLDKSLKLRKIGPRIYPIDQIKESIGQTNFKRLSERAYKIKPDPKVGVWPRTEANLPDEEENPFGGISHINVMGNQNGKNYMRFSIGKTARDAEFGQLVDADGALGSLETKLKQLLPEIGGRIHLKRGDMLIVNNRRAATQWESGAKIRGVPSEVDLKPGDRTIFQMGFYYPDEI